MRGQAEISLLVLTVALMCLSSSSAATIEMAHSLPGARLADTNLQPPGRDLDGLYRAVSINHRGDVRFSSGILELAKPEELVWLAIGEPNRLGLPLPRATSETTLHSVEAKHLLVHKTGHGSAPTENTAPEIWAVILIGVGLIWARLRRKTRRGAILFTGA